ncbi:LacI family DNA-binding transcriptional regulator [Lysobacter humi (ex Lee et al. 2017)]
MRIEDVAEAAQVSMKTVSRVLNREPNVREATREKVMAAVERLRYVPNLSARSLAGSRSFLIALLYDNPSGNYLTEVMSGVLTACEANDYAMLMCPLEGAGDALIAHVDGLIRRAQPDGLVLTPPLTDRPELLEHLREVGMPFASISPRDRSDGIGVGMDETRAAYDMVMHLVVLGHRRIGHITGHAAHGASGWRLAGYRQALKDAKLRFEAALVVPGEFSFESGVRAARRLLDLANPPTAIFAANDDMAAGVISVAYERGLSVPAQLSVCGFDDIPLAHQISPPLTTVQQPTREMGRLSTLGLLAAIRDPDAGTMATIPYTLCVRASTGPAPRE